MNSQGLLTWLRVTCACAQKDIRSALTEPMTLIQSITLPANYLFMIVIFVLPGSHASTAVVMDDHSRYAREFVTTMRDARSFRLEETTAAQAARQLQQGTLVAAVTIPRGFGDAVAARRPVAVTCQVADIDQDLTLDAQRAMGLVVTSFYARYLPGTVPVTITEHDAYAHDTGYIPFLAVSVIILAIMVSGMLQAGGAAAREWETGTIVETAMAPAPPLAVLAGRMAGSFTIALPSVAVVTAVVIWAVGDHPVHAAMAAAVCAGTLAVFVAAGVALGMAIKDRTSLAVLIRGIPVPLTFLSGLFGPLTFQAQSVQILGDIFPIHYATVLAQDAFLGFTTGTLPLRVDAAILAGCFALFTALAALAAKLSRPAGRPA